MNHPPNKVTGSWWNATNNNWKQAFVRAGSVRWGENHGYIWSCSTFFYWECNYERMFYCCFFQSSELLICLSTSCAMKSHIICLAENFLAAEKCEEPMLLPISGDCVLCGTNMLWGDLIRKKQGCYQSTQVSITNRSGSNNIAKFKKTCVYSFKIQSPTWYRHITFSINESVTVSLPEFLTCSQP